MNDDSRDESLTTGDSVAADDEGNEIDGEIVLVPEGDYELRFLYHETAKYQDSAKVYLHFAIYTGEYAGLPLVRYYNVARLKSPPARNGKFVAKALGDFPLEMALIGLQPTRLDRFPLSKLRGKRISGRVLTVQKNRQGDSRPYDVQYSKIAQLLGVLPNEDWQV